MEKTMLTKENFLRISQDITILYAEKDTHLATLNYNILSQFFHKVDLASNATQVLELYHQDQYDIIITDTLLPEVNSIELVKKIKKINDEQHIVITSANDSTELLPELINLGVNSFLFKPLDSNKIITSLYQICKLIQNSRKLDMVKQNNIVDSTITSANPDINQSLTCVLGYTDLCLQLNTQKYNDQDITKYLNTLKKCAKDISGTLSKLEQLKALKSIDFHHDIQMFNI